MSDVIAGNSLKSTLKKEVSNLSKMLEIGYFQGLEGGGENEKLHRLKEGRKENLELDEEEK